MMTEFENRLRAALRGAAEPAPPGLLAAVMRRHRRHKLRAGASVLAVAVAAALAVPPVSAALRATGRGTGPAPATSPSHASRPVAAPGSVAPGTVLSGCGASNAGAIGRRWRAGAIHEAGPLWFINGGHSAGRVRLYVAIAVLDGLRPGSAVVLKVAPAWRPYLRFMYGPRDALSPGIRYTMRRGEYGVTFIACRPDQQMVPFAGVTDYYGGFLVKGAHCVPVQVTEPGRKDPVTIRLGACAGR